MLTVKIGVFIQLKLSKLKTWEAFLKPLEHVGTDGEKKLSINGLDRS